MVYTATLITAKAVIAAKAGILESTPARPAGGGPGQARNDKLDRTYVVMYRSLLSCVLRLSEAGLCLSLGKTYLAEYP